MSAGGPVRTPCDLLHEIMDGAIGAPVVEVAALRSPGAAIGYLGLHHRKPQQAPPRGWRGMVERHSRSYFTRPVAELREQARRRAWPPSGSPSGTGSRSPKSRSLEQATRRSAR